MHWTQNSVFFFSSASRRPTTAPNASIVASPKTGKSRAAAGKEAKPSSSSVLGKLSASNTPSLSKLVKGKCDEHNLALTTAVYVSRVCTRVLIP